MDMEFASKSFILYLLFVMDFYSIIKWRCAQGSRGSAMKITDNNELRLPTDGKFKIQIRSNEANDMLLHGGHSDGNPTSSHMNHHMDASLMVFFFLDDLKVGKKFPIFFRKRDPSKTPQLLAREEANDIPFSYKDYPYLLNFFSFRPNSPQAKAMEETLTQCELKPIKGENKTCATSMESMLDFVHETLGWESQFQALSTTHLTESSVSLQNYTILKTPVEIPAPKMVACHTMPYPYAIFYCHSQMSVNKVFVASLVGENEDRVEAVAVCHLDTSKWNRNHVSFQVLGVEPGSVPVCHFFPHDNPVYVPVIGEYYTLILNRSLD